MDMSLFTNYSATIPVLSQHYNDSTSIEKLLDTCNKLPYFFGKPFYVLYEKDTSRYALTIYTPFFNRSLVTKYRIDGSPVSTSQYNKLNHLTGVFQAFYPGYKLQFYGNYRDGFKKGKWRYFNENGRLVKKEIYRKGKLIRTKELATPRFTYYSMFFRNIEPITYKITEANDTTLVKFASTLYSEYNYIKGFVGFTFSEHIMNLAGLRNDPYMLGLPKDNAFSFGVLISIGDRRKFFGSVDMALNGLPGIGEKNGYYTVHPPGMSSIVYPINVSNAMFRWNLSANYPVLGRKKKTTLFLVCGTEFAEMFPTSKTVLNNGQTTSYWVVARINQNWMINTGLMLDRIIGKGRQGFFTSLYIKAGYNFSPLPAVWYDNSNQQKTKLLALPLYPISQGLPYINMGGLYVTVGINAWRGKNKKIKSI
ncbi:MAG TPA: hypothetical protein VNZ49_06630 [Bacteroidia bacterium]|nr:hypothetical protein [Bacteroidia bacterium]